MRSVLRRFTTGTTPSGLANSSTVRESVGDCTPVWSARNLHDPIRQSTSRPRSSWCMRVLPPFDRGHDVPDGCRDRSARQPVSRTRRSPSVGRTDQPTRSRQESTEQQSFAVRDTAGLVEIVANPIGPQVGVAGESGDPQPLSQRGHGQAREYWTPSGRTCCPARPSPPATGTPTAACRGSSGPARHTGRPARFRRCNQLCQQIVWA